MDGSPSNRVPFASVSEVPPGAKPGQSHRLCYLVDKETTRECWTLLPLPEAPYDACVKQTGRVRPLAAKSIAYTTTALCGYVQRVTCSQICATLTCKSEIMKEWYTDNG